jgi:hypothetical protein
MSKIGQKSKFTTIILFGQVNPCNLTYHTEDERFKIPSRHSSVIQKRQWFLSKLKAPNSGIP